MNAAAKAGLSIEAFESGSIDADAFDHESHVYIAWLYLERYSVSEAIARFTAAIKRLTESLGQADKYHETITWFFMLLIAERRSLTGACDWLQFRRCNEDVCASPGAILNQYYSRDVLASVQARQSFMLPNKLGQRVDSAA